MSTLDDASGEKEVAPFCSDLLAAQNSQLPLGRMCWPDGGPPLSSAKRSTRPASSAEVRFPRPWDALSWRRQAVAPSEPSK